MQEDNLGRDRMSHALLIRAGAVEQCRLEAEDSLLLLAVDARANENEAIGVPQPWLQRRASAADGDLVALILDDFEVVGELQAGLVLRDGQLRRLPRVAL